MGAAGACAWSAFAFAFVLADAGAGLGTFAAPVLAAAGFVAAGPCFKAAALPPADRAGEGGALEGALTPFPAALRGGPSRGGASAAAVPAPAPLADEAPALGVGLAVGAGRAAARAAGLAAAGAFAAGFGE